MSKNQQIIIYQKIENLPKGLREALKARGNASSVCTTDHELYDQVRKNSDSILIVYFSTDADLATEIGKLCEAESLHQTPIIVIGAGIDKFESYLNKYFILAATIITPCGNPDIVSAVQYVTRYIERIRSQKKESTENSSIPPVESYSLLYREFDAVPKMVFDKLKELDIFKKDIGGAMYATTFRPQELENKFYLTTDPRALNLIENISTVLSVHRFSRFNRICLLSFEILNALRLSNDAVEDAKIAMTIYSSNYISAGKNLSQVEFLLADRFFVRKEICSRIKDSILELSSIFPEERIKKIVILIGKLIGEEEALDNSNECIIASAIATADAVDRIIYQRNTFQPVSAYCVLSRLKRDSYSYIHPLVLGILIKILAEAVTSEAAGIARTKKLTQIPQLVEAASDIDEAIIRGEERNVALSNLEPGMRLKRPVTTYDGKVILNETMTLDQDLIWRLWQLSAVRPVQSKITVSQEE